MQQRVDALLVRSIKIIIKEHLKKIAINLPKVIDELVKLQRTVLKNMSDISSISMR